MGYGINAQYDNTECGINAQYGNTECGVGKRYGIYICSCTWDVSPTLRP
jgi:hypothetical protein